MISDNAIKVCSSLVRNVPLWMGISLVWEAVHMWGQGLCGNSLHSMSHFAVNLKLLQRNKAYSKRKTYKQLMKRHVQVNKNTERSMTQKLCSKTARLQLPVLLYHSLLPWPTSGCPHLSKKDTHL